MQYEAIQYGKADGIATIVLNRPDSFNAFTVAMGEELQDAVDRCAAEDVRSVVITGAGRAFSSGGDIRAMKETLQGDVIAYFLHLTKAVHDAVLAIRALPKPVIASINGPVAGGALGLALACDLRIASDAAKFNTAYLNIAGTPDCGNSYFLARTVGIFKATEMLLLPESIDAAEALRIGLIHRVAPAAELEQRTTELAKRLAASPTLAIGRMKHLLNAALHNDLSAQLNEEGWSIAQSGASEDFREGVSAFLAKRPAEFKGR